MVEVISRTEYMLELIRQRHLSLDVRLNVSKDVPTEAIFLKSKEGMSYVRTDGYLGGLFRFKDGYEKVAKLHQDVRIKLGGYWLDCYEGKLSKEYEKRGFKIVSKLDFSEEEAPEGWDKSNQTINKPNVVFMSLFVKDGHTPILYPSRYYEQAKDFALFSKNICASKG